MQQQNTLAINMLKRSQWVLRKVVSWLEAVQSSVFMGLVDDDSFQPFDTYPFDETTSIDVTAEAAQGLDPWERRIARDYLVDASEILVIGAGGGRELIGLNDLGYKTTGVEYGRELCEATRRELTLRCSTATIDWSERFEIPQGERPYDAAFIARKFLSHVHDRQRRVEFLENIRRTLRPDATLVLGYYTRDRDTLAFRMQAGLANLLRLIRGQREFPVEVGDHLDTESPLFHHHYVWEELRNELREAGFTPIEHETTWFGWAVARVVPTDASRHSEKDDHTNETTPDLVETC